MKWLVEISAISIAIYFAIIYVGDTSQPCNCPTVPKNYFFIETKETEMCVDENRQTIVTKVTKSGKVDFN